MIQRIQTIWLFLAAVCGFVFTQIPLYVATTSLNVTRKFVATESLLLFAAGIAISLLALATVFLFKNRPLQFRLAVAGIFASIGLIALEVWQIEVFKTANETSKASYSWGSLLPIAMVIFFWLAGSGISRDQKLIKSLDRLR